MKTGTLAQSGVESESYKLVTTKKHHPHIVEEVHTTHHHPHGVQ